MVDANPKDAGSRRASDSRRPTKALRPAGEIRPTEALRPTDALGPTDAHRKHANPGRTAESIRIEASPENARARSLDDARGILGWDVGGAHLKAAGLDGAGRLVQVEQIECPLWTGMDKLDAAIGALFQRLPPGPWRHAVTMTGEMADLFPNRGDGVRRIVEALVRRLVQERGEVLWVFAAPRAPFDSAQRRRGRTNPPGGANRFPAASDFFLLPADCAGREEDIASANWIATAACCAAALADGLLVDIGSTTTDLVPFAGGRVTARGGNDGARLDAGELAYTGIVRTPLLAMAERAPVNGRWRATIKEYYATTADVFRVLGELDEACDVQPTADNGPKTVEGSARRLLRAVGEDLSESTRDLAVHLARWYRERLIEDIVATVHLQGSRGAAGARPTLVAAGIGRFLVPEVARRVGLPHRTIDEVLAPDVEDEDLRAWAGHCAPAVAVARLARAAHA